MFRDIAKFDVSLLIAFHTLMEETNVSRAAKRLGVTQQGLSGRLARMRAAFGDPLFVRDGAGVAPTPAAQALQPRVAEALASLRALVGREAFAPANFEGVFTLAASDYAAALVLPALMSALQAQAPGVRLAVRHVQSPTLRIDMREGRVDLALTTPAFAPDGLRARKLLHERYVGAARPDHPLFAREIDLQRFCAFPHLLVSPERQDFFGPTDEALAVHSLVRRVALVVPTFSVAPGILAGSDLIAVLPERLALGAPAQLRTFETPAPVKGFDLVAYWPERIDREPAQRWFRGLCFDALSAGAALPGGVAPASRARAVKLRPPLTAGP